MAPTERFRLPLRWEFAPVQSKQDKSILWQWRAYSQTGTLKMESKGLFDTLTECMDDAKARGYDPVRG